MNTIPRKQVIYGEANYKNLVKPNGKKNIPNQGIGVSWYIVLGIKVTGCFLLLFNPRNSNLL